MLLSNGFERLAYVSCLITKELIVQAGARSKFWGVVRVEGQGWGDNSIQFINFRRVGDKSFKEWRQKIGGGRVVTTIFRRFCPAVLDKMPLFCLFLYTFAYLLN